MKFIDKVARTLHRYNCSRISLQHHPVEVKHLQANCQTTSDVEDEVTSEVDPDVCRRTVMIYAYFAGVLL